MEEQFIPYKQALALKKLGFNEPCLANYNNLTDETRLILGRTDKGSITVNKVPYTDNIVISDERILAPLYQQALEFLLKKVPHCSYRMCYNDTGDVSVDGHIYDIFHNKRELIQKLLEIIKRNK